MDCGHEHPRYDCLVCAEKSLHADCQKKIAALEAMVAYEQERNLNNVISHSEQIAKLEEIVRSLKLQVMLIHEASTSLPDWLFWTEKRIDLIKTGRCRVGEDDA